MHKAPSVAYPVGPCSFERWVYASVTMLTSATLVAWGAVQGLSALWCLATSVATAGAFLAWQNLRQVGHLVWDGHTWRWLSPRLAQELDLTEVRVVLDLQKTLLLRCQTPSAPLQRSVIWLWVSQSAQSPHWQDLRRAAHPLANRH